MAEAYEFSEIPGAIEIFMLAGWSQWADAGSVSSGLPAYLIKFLNARKIGQIKPDGFYLFQIPGTQDLLRPVVRFEGGYPVSLGAQHNEFFYWENGSRGLVIFLGDEPQIDAERYVAALLDAARHLGVKRMISFGGVYGELPYDKERMISGIISLERLKNEIASLSLNLSDYQGGASIGSYTCRRAGERGMELVGMYAFVPMYDFSGLEHLQNTLRIENDFTAWLGIMRRVNYMLKLDLDLADLEQRSQKLIESIDAKIAELEQAAPNSGIRDYMQQLSSQFEEIPFEPLDDFWEENLRQLFDRLDEDE